MQSSTPPAPRARIRWPWVLLALMAGIACGAFGGYQYARLYAQTLPALVITAEQFAAQNAAVQRGHAESRFLRAQLDTADGEIAVERAARKELEVQLRAGQDELGQVRDRLAFFEQLLPPGPEGAVDIRGAEVHRDGPGLRYRILLMRSGGADVPFGGSLRFQASGVLKGEEVSIDLLPMQRKVEGSTESSIGDTAAGKTAEKANESLSLQFDKYQRSEGLLDLPEGFVPESVVVSVLEGSTVRASRTIRLGL